MSAINKTASEMQTQRRDDHEAGTHGISAMPTMHDAAAPVQRMSEGEASSVTESKVATSATLNHTGLPDNMKANLENLSGFDMSDIRVHRNAPEPAQVGALAYTQGTDIYLGPGQEQHLGHEAWHSAQYKQGRVSVNTSFKSADGSEVAGNDQTHLEREADVMGTKLSSRNFSSPPVTQLKTHGSHMAQTSQTLVARKQAPVQRVEDENKGGVWNSIKRSFATGGRAMIRGLRSFDQSAAALNRRMGRGIDNAVASVGRSFATGGRAIRRQWRSWFGGKAIPDLFKKATAEIYKLVQDTYSRYVVATESPWLSAGEFKTRFKTDAYFRREMFTFAKTEFSDENVEFLTRIESEGENSLKDQMLIFEQYIRENSPRMINISYENRREIYNTLGLDLEEERRNMEGNAMGTDWEFPGDTVS